MIFICDVNENQEAMAIKKELDSWHEMAEEKLAFLKKQANNLEQEKTAIWTKFFNIAIASGRVPKDSDRKDYEMMLGGDTNSQLMVKKKDNDLSPEAFFNFLKGLS